MKDWPHAPTHRFNEKGTYMITGATYEKVHIFKRPQELDIIQEQLFEISLHYGWILDSWAIFPNHYHFIAHSPDNPLSLRPFLNQLHSNTARIINEMQGQIGRQVWYNFWDSHLTYEKSYKARLNYVMQNPVRHKIVQDARDYDWCSARWFAKNATTAQYKTITGFKIDKVNVMDDFD